MHKNLLYIILFLSFTQFFFAQEDGVVAFTLPSRNSLKFNQYNINPTFSFVREQNKYISFSNKRDWVQFDDAPQTYLFSYSGRFKENTGMGVGFFQQNYGVLTTFGGVLNYAYNAVLSNDNNLTFGMNLAFYKSGLNEGKLIGDVSDSSLNNIPSNTVIAINPGINYGTDFLDFGVSLNNIVSYNFKTSKMLEDNPEQSIQGHIMYTGFVNSRGFLDESKFSGLLRSEFKKDKTVISGMIMLSVPKGIWAQTGYNTLYGLSAGIGINISSQIALEYNYEKGTGAFSNFGSSHDITLAYKFNNRYKYNYSGDEEEEALIFSDKKSKRPVAKRKTTTTTKTPVDRNTIAEAKAKAKLEAEADAKATLLAEAKANEEAKLKQAAELKAKADAENQTKLAAEAKANAEEDTRIKLAEQAKAKLAAEAKIVTENKVKLAAEAKAKAEEEARVKLAEQAKVKAEAEAKLKVEAEAKAKLELEVQEKLAATKAAEEALAKLAEAARLKAEEEARIKLAAETKAKEEARIKLAEEAKARADAEATAKLALEAQEKLAATKAVEEAQAKLAEAARLKAEEEARIKLAAETIVKEEARIKLAEEAKARADAEAKAKLALEAKPAPIDNTTRSMNNLTRLTEESKIVQQDLLTKLSEKVASKKQDLKDLKEENDLSEQGIFNAPKAFKSVTAENAALESLKFEIDDVIKSQNLKISELENLYIERLKNVPSKTDSINVSYLNKIQALKSGQIQAIQSRENLVSALADIKVATEIERKRRIKRAAYDNEQDKYLKDRAALKQIQQFTPESPVPLTVDDFDFGEEQSNNIQIVKDVTNEESGYYLVLAVHSNVAKRDEFLAKSVSLGQTNINFFYDVNTSKYYIYYEKFDDITTAKKALQSKGNAPYNGKMSMVKIEK